MKTDITTWYNKPSCFFRISYETRKCISHSVNELLVRFPLPKVKAETLEILLCNDGTDRFEIIKCSTGRGKYLTYQFWLPYPKITKDKITDNEPFTDYLFEGLVQALVPFGVPESEIRDTQAAVKAEIVNNTQYEYVPTKDDKVMEIVLDKMRELYKNNPNVVV